MPAAGIVAPAMLEELPASEPLSLSASSTVSPSAPSSASLESVKVDPAVITVANTRSPASAVKR